jgi:hypothetical protein
LQSGTRAEAENDAPVPPPATPSREPAQIADALAETPARTTEEFGIECGLCGTRLYATPDKIGRHLTCPDCHSDVLVKPPKIRSKPTASPPDEDETGDTFTLSEPVQRPQTTCLTNTSWEATSEETTEAEASPSADGAGPRASSLGGVMAAQARQFLAKAKAELEDRERGRVKLPERPFATGVISFLFDPHAAVRWLALTLMLQVLVTLLKYVILLGSSASILQMAAMMLSMVAALFGLAFVFTAAACFLAILQDTANGHDKIEQWPGVNFLDWMMDGFYVVNGLFAAAVPGVLIGQIPACAGAPSFFPVLGGTLSFVALFPVLVLSMCDQQSPLSIASPAVWRSLLEARPLWTKFYLISSGMTFAALLALGVMVVSPFLVSALVGAFVIAVAMVYFRLLGRLACCLGERDAPA